MKFIGNYWPGLVAALVLSAQSGFSQTPAATMADGTVGLSPAAAGVVQMAQGVSDSVVLDYIQNSQAPFNLSADNVIYLQDIGLSAAVVTAMVNHDKGLPAQNNSGQQLYAPAIPAPGAAAAPPADYVGNAPDDVTYFYNDLSPYGTWVDLDTYGWCWQPTAVSINSQWRPYCDSGHWTYTDAGWFWQSDYSWGWAPFHYGRWIRHNRAGWVWFPDRVWGPAWVTWRTAGNDCGWAPLPLHATFDVNTGFRFNGVSVGLNHDFGLLSSLFTFVAINDFCQNDLARRCLPPAEATRVFNNATVINNYGVNKDKLIVNNGIPVERVRQATRAELKPVAIRDVPAGTKVQAGSGVVYRHELHAPVSAASIRAQKVDDRNPTIRHAALAPVNPGPRARPGNAGAVVVTVPTQPRNENPKSAPAPARITATPGGQAAKSANEVEIAPPLYLHGKPGDSVTPLPPKQNPTPTADRQPWQGDQQAYQAKGHHQVTESHALPPLNDPDSRTVPAPDPYPPGKNPHVYQPKIQQKAGEAHALPPINTPPPLTWEQTHSQPQENPVKVTSPKDNSKSGH